VTRTAPENPIVLIPARLAATRLPGAPSYVHGLINLRGTIVTVVDLGARLEATHERVAGEGSIMLVSMPGSTRVVGVAVQEVMDVRVVGSARDDVIADSAGNDAVRGLAHVDGATVILLSPANKEIARLFPKDFVDDEAERELRAYIGPAGKDLPARKIPIRAGHRETFWKGNCVAVGLAAGFLEPLEASAIVLVELSAKIIAEQMPADATHVKLLEGGPERHLGLAGLVGGLAFATPEAGA